MQVRRAAEIGRILIIIHLVLSLLLGFVNFSRTMRHGTPPSVMLHMLAYIIATILLDAALLIVFSSLTRTKEQQIMDSEE